MPDEPAPSPSRLPLFLYAFLAALTLLRLILIAQFELTPDEAYYSMWAERLDISYYSKGPGIAATMWAGTHLFGLNEFGIRFFSPLLSLGTSLLIFGFARRLYSESVGLWTVLMLQCVPIFQAGSLLMTIDPLSIFFWTAALVTTWRAIEQDGRWSWWWPATGALIGVGFLCKYTNAIQLLSILLLLLFTSRYRRELLRPGFYSMLGAFLPFLLPPVIWNAQHDWITLSHLSARGGLQKAFKIDFGEFFTFIGQHFGAYSPLLFGALLVGGAWGFVKARRSFKARFLLAFALPLWVIYLWLALKQAGEANWTSPAMVSLGILAVACWYERAAERTWLRTFAVVALALGFLISVATLNTDLLRSVGVPFPYKLDPSKRLRGWRSSAEQLEALRADFEKSHGAPPFLIANSYGTAANLGFYLRDKRPAGPGHPPIYFPESPAIENQFSFWPRYDEFVSVPADQLDPNAYFTEQQGINPFHGRNALYITDRAEEKAPSTIKEGFNRVEMIAVIDQKRRGLPLRQWRVFACYDYRSLPL
ncbi:MAG TPA: glycosyltransferase family 39 protein [Chthoniobacteraceae bacterium]